jgi:hypothetical protein
MLAGNTVWNPYSVTGSYDSLATVTLSANQSSIVFSNIPSTYAHLQIRAIFRNTNSGTGVDWVDMQLNGDTGSNYKAHYLIGDGGSASAAVSGLTTGMITALGNPNSGNTANAFGAGIFDILDYANTNKYKTVRTLHGLSNNATSENYVGINSGLWMSTAAITSITLYNNTGGANFAPYSSFALYGVKA